MPAAWMFTDGILQEQLNAWLDAVKPVKQWYVALFRNDYTPVSSSVFADFVEANFAGYATLPVDMASWPGATVVNHVAISTNTHTYNFQADSSGVSPQTVYGYFVYDEDDVLVYAERWTDSFSISDGAKIDLVLKLKHKTATP